MTLKGQAPEFRWEEGAGLSTQEPPQDTLTWPQALLAPPASCPPSLPSPRPAFTPCSFR